MAILRKPKMLVGGEEKFIADAPDAAAEMSSTPYDKGIAKGRKRQISLTIHPELLRRVDEIAKRTGQGRAGVINMAIYRALSGDPFL